MNSALAGEPGGRRPAGPAVLSWLTSLIWLLLLGGSGFSGGSSAPGCTRYSQEPGSTQEMGPPRRVGLGGTRAGIRAGGTAASDPDEHRAGRADLASGPSRTPKTPKLGNSLRRAVR